MTVYEVKVYRTYGVDTFLVYDQIPKVTGLNLVYWETCTGEMQMYPQDRIVKVTATAKPDDGAR